MAKAPGPARKESSVIHTLMLTLLALVAVLALAILLLFLRARRDRHTGYVKEPTPRRPPQNRKL